MTQLIVSGMIIRLVWGLCTLYMICILLRWTSTWLGLNLYGGWLRWIPRLTDPLFGWIRRTLPPLGPMDYAPVLALFAVWLLREITAMTFIRLLA